jgi:teichuronic acid biosynthesis glycosyltransferase TuaH
VYTFYRETWSDARRRNMYMPGDRLADTLIASRRVRRLLIANPYRSAPIQWVRRLSGVRPEAFDESDRRVLLSPRRLGRGDPTSVRSLERLYVAYDRAIERAAADAGLENPAMITTSPFVAGYAPLRWASRVTFYAWDDWPSGLPVRRWWPAYEEAFARVRQTGRGVIGVSQAVIDRIDPTGPSAVVPNGIVPSEWRAPAPPPPWFAGLPSPRLLYIGQLDDRLDAEAIRDIAARFSHGTVVLLGPVIDRPTIDPLIAIPNLRVEPPVARAELASIVHAADACVMPHVSNRLTAAMSPLKLYEYVAGGRPVVATDLPPVRVVDPRIVRVREGESFADGVAAALDRGPLTEEDRLAFIDANSWSRRHEQMLTLAFADGADRSANGIRPVDPAAPAAG